MAIYEITAPDGSVYEITAPEGATEAQVLAYVKSQIGAGAPSTETPEQPKPVKESGSSSSFLRGLRDPIDAGAQLLERSLPESAVSAVNRLNNWLAARGLPLEPIGPEGLTGQLREQEQAYQAGRGPDPGFDWGRLSGNLLSPANIAMASRIPVAATTGGRVTTGLLGGAALGPLQAPAYGENFAKEKATQAGLGALGGALVPLGTSALSSVVSPAVGPQARMLAGEGVRMTPGQKLGGAFKNWEDKATSIPGVGHMIQARRAEGYADFNRVAVNKALKRVGKELPADIDTGHRALAYMQSELGESYDDLLATMSGKVDTQLQTDINEVFKLAQALPEDIQKYLSGVVAREINGRITKHGTMSGRSVKEIQSALSNEIRSIVNPTGWDIQRKQALSEIKDSFMRMVDRQNPTEKTKKLAKINASWRDSEIMHRAAQSVAAEDGIFTPAQLVNATKALDKSKNKRAFAQGRAAMQPYASAGKSVLPSQVPDSGTAGRIMSNSPLAGLGALGMGAPFAPLYTRPGMAAMNAAFTQRPQFAQGVSDAIQSATPYLIPGGVVLSQGLLGSQP